MQTPIEPELEEVLSGIHGLPEGEDFKRRGRKVIMHDELLRLKKHGSSMPKTCTVFLFNDMLLYAEKSSSKKGASLKYSGHKNLKDAFFIDSDSKNGYAFEIMDKTTKKSVRFATKSLSQREMWRNKIDNCTASDCRTTGPDDCDFLSFGSSPRNSFNGSSPFDHFSLAGLGLTLSGSTSDMDGSEDGSVDSPPSSVTSHLKGVQSDWTGSSTNSDDDGDDSNCDPGVDEDGNLLEKVTPEARLVREDGEWEIAAAPLNTLLWWIICEAEREDSVTVRTFLYSCPVFATAQELFDTLLRIYDLETPVPSVIRRRYSRCDTRRRWIGFLKVWLENFFERDFALNKILYERLLAFMCRLVQENEAENANTLKITIIRVNKKRLAKKGLNRFSQLQIPSQSASSSSSSSARSVPQPMSRGLQASTSGMFSTSSLGGVLGENKVSEWNVTDMAEQFALIEFGLFKSVELRELCRLAWKSPTPRRTSPNVVSLFARFDMVCQWAATEIVMAETNKRVACIEKLIQLAQKCFELRNFNSLMELLAGLNRGSVQRMKKAWEAVSPAAHQTFRQLNDIFEMRNNFRNYREQLRLIANASGPAVPCLPYFGMYLRDLIFSAEGNPDKINDYINLERLRIDSKILREIEGFQKTPYPFPEDEKMQSLLRRLLASPEEMLYKYSQQVEPTAPRT